MSRALHSVIVGLQAVENGTLPVTHGSLLHAAFMDMLRWANPQDAQDMHDANRLKPFTLSPLQGIGRGHKGHILVRAGQACFFRATFTEQAVLRDFATYFVQGHSTLRLSRVQFAVTAIHTSATGHALARITTTDALRTDWDSAPLAERALRIPLCFDTPTAFSFRGEQRQMYLLPDPTLVWSTLARYWDNLTGDDQQESVRAFVAENVVISYYRIQTVMLRFPDHLQIGFSGPVTFKILDPARPDLTRHLNRLADLAFFTGLGSKTTMGMGQVRRIGREGWGGDEV